MTNTSAVFIRRGGLSFMTGIAAGCAAVALNNTMHCAIAIIAIALVGGFLSAMPEVA